MAKAAVNSPFDTITAGSVGKRLAARRYEIPSQFMILETMPSVLEYPPRCLRCSKK